MNNYKTFEERLYETLGIKKFKKIVIKLQLILRKFLFWREDFKSNYDNYFIKNQTIESYKNFKIFGLLINSGIHFPALIRNVDDLVTKLSMPNIDVSSIISTSILMGINTYCCMLQRYNHIRINKVIKKLEERDKKREEKLNSNEDLQSTPEISKTETMEKSNLNTPLYQHKSNREIVIDILNKKRKKLINCRNKCLTKFRIKKLSLEKLYNK